MNLLRNKSISGIQKIVPLQLAQYNNKRGFAITTPKSKLHFIEHPKHGRVYPVITYDLSKNYYSLPLFASMGHALVNSMLLYGSFVYPLFTPVIQSFICNPVFLGPSVVFNYMMLSKYYVFFFGARSHIQNIFLLPSGKSVIVETRDGDTKEIVNNTFHEARPFTSRFENRLDIIQGANIYYFLRGNTQFHDKFILNAILKKEFIDVNNVAYDYDVSSEFTWNYRELVEIKKRKRVVHRFLKPTARVLQKEIGRI